jgi:hypothetical protein
MLVTTLSTQGLKIPLALEYDRGCSDLIRVSEAEMNLTNLETLGDGGRSTVEAEQRSSRSKSHDFDIMPATRSTEARADGLVERLLGRETSGQRRQRMGQTEAIFHFAAGK